MKNNIDKLKALNDIDDKFIEEADDLKESTGKPENIVPISGKAEKKVFNIKKWSAVAAAVVILAVSVTALTLGLRAGKGNKDNKADLLPTEEDQRERYGRSRAAYSRLLNSLPSFFPTILSSSLLIHIQQDFSRQFFPICFTLSLIRSIRARLRQKKSAFL